MRDRSLWPTASGARGVALLLLAVLLGGCGYSHKQVFPTQYHTVSVPIFQNRSFYRGVEFELTEALVKEIELRTPYKVVSDAAAGTALTGTVVAVEQAPLSRARRGGVPQVVEMVVTVDWVWRDNRTGETIRERRGFQSAGRYAPTRPVGQPLEVAQHEAVRRLAGDIVSTMQADW
jgi:hypothetical protein